MQSYLTIWDLLLTPIYLFILINLAKRTRDKLYPRGHPLRPYYLPGLYAKFLGAIFIGLIYEFYYGGGDTFNYFYHARVINSSLSDSFSTWMDLILHASPDQNPRLYPYTSQMYWYGDSSTYTVSSMAAVFGLLNGTTYIPIALIFAFISYSGIWAMYRTFVALYPTYYKKLAIAFLFIPSTFVWGSAIFKDTVCMFGLGWLTYCTFRVIVNRDFSIKNLLLLAVSFYLIAIIKIYILLAFVPALSLWLLLTYSAKIRIVAIRWVVNILFLLVSFAGFLYSSQKFADQLQEYSLDNIIEKAGKTQRWIVYISAATEGSAYDLGTYDPTLQGMLSKFPQAVTVTLFRPFLWEARKPIMVLSALESITFLYFTLSVFYKRGLVGTFRHIFSDPTLLFFFVFSIIFAFSVGISTGNFGTLSRYKIPCMPFFAALLVILYNQPKLKTKIINAPKRQKPVHHFA